MDIPLGAALVAGKAHPADAEAGHAVGFRQAIEGNREQVGGKRGQRGVLLAVHDHPVVNFVGKQNKAEFPRKPHNTLKYFGGIQNTGRIVGVDDHNPLCSRGDFIAHVIKVGGPVICLVADIMNRCSSGQRHRGGPERIIGHRNENFVPAVKQSLHRHSYQLADPVSGVYILQPDIRDFFELTVLHYSLACRKNAL